MAPDFNKRKDNEGENDLIRNISLPVKDEKIEIKWEV